MTGLEPKIEPDIGPYVGPILDPILNSILDPFDLCPWTLSALWSVARSLFVCRLLPQPYIVPI